MYDCSKACLNYSQQDCSKWFLDRTSFVQTLVSDIEKSVYYAIDVLFKERVEVTLIDRLFASIISPIDEIIFSLMEYSNEYLTDERATGCLSKYPSY